MRRHTATTVLIGICAGVFVWLAARQGDVPWGFWGPALPLDAITSAGGIAVDLVTLEPWRLVSAGFLHASALQLLLTLFSLKRQAEIVEENRGARCLLIGFVVTTAAGYLTSRFWYGPWGPMTVGASPAVFGLTGFDVTRRLREGTPFSGTELIQTLVILLALVLVMPLNNPAHVGGLIAGSIVGLLPLRTPRGGLGDQGS